MSTVQIKHREYRQKNIKFATEGLVGAKLSNASVNPTLEDVEHPGHTVKRQARSISNRSLTGVTRCASNAAFCMSE